MPEETVYKGVWWLPKNPGEVLSGQLTLTSNNKATLELWGNLRDVVIDQDYDTPLILGISNEKITLYGCHLINHTESHKMGFSGLPSYLFHIDIVFIGEHFNTEEVHFKKILIRYTNLDAWSIGLGNIKTEYKKRSKRYLIQCEIPRPLKIHIAGYNLTVYYEGLYKESVPGENLTQASITLKVWIIAFSRQKKSLDDFINFLHYIQNFLSLVIGGPTYPLEMYSENKISREVSSKIEIRYHINEWSKEAKAIYWFNMPFLFKDIKENLEFYLSNWFNKAAEEKLKPVYDLFFGIMYNPHLYISVKFLILTQALEAYYRRCGHYKGKYQANDEYKQGMYENLKNVIQPIISDHNFRNSVIKRLEFANQYSLRKMLGELTKTVKELIEPYKSNDAEILKALEFIKSSKKIDDFVCSVVKKRNDLTHYDPESKLDNENSISKDRHRETIEFLCLIHRLAFMLEICLFKEIGIFDDAIRLYPKTITRAIEMIIRHQYFYMLPSYYNQ